MSLYGYKPKGRPALWLQVPNAKPVRAALKRQRAALPRKRINPISKRQRQRLRGYGPARAAFLSQYPLCSVWIARLGGWHLARNPTTENCRVLALICYLAPVATTIHHCRGRAGSLLMDQRYWIGASLLEHDWIDRNRAAARRFGLLAEVGKWGNPD